jgi:cell wall-associated NlpC family hydrolase
MTNRRSTKFAFTAATLAAGMLGVAASALAAPPSPRTAVIGTAVVGTAGNSTVGNSTEGAPVARSTRIAAAPRHLLAGPVPRVRFAVTPLLTPSIPTGRDSLAHAALDAIGAFKAFAHHPSISNLGRYAQQRNLVAAAAARRLGLSQGAMQRAWNRADTSHQIALLSAFTQMGVPYRHISRRPGVGFDCSGLTSWAWDQVGVNMSHVANAQIREIKNVDPKVAEAGDIAYFPGHAMMYLGVSTAIIHAPYTGRNVEIDVLTYHQSSTRYGDPLPNL